MWVIFVLYVLEWRYIVEWVLEWYGVLWGRYLIRFIIRVKENCIIEGDFFYWYKIWILENCGIYRKKR